MLQCKSCNHDKFTTSKQVFKNGIEHLRANCAQCGAYLCYVPQVDSEEKEPGDFVMPFGKHKGQKLKTLPQDYLRWLALECRSKAAGQYAKVYLKSVFERVG